MMSGGMTEYIIVYGNDVGIHGLWQLHPICIFGV